MALSRKKREEKILELLQEKRELGVSELAVTLGISEVTVRADLKLLGEQDLIVRTWGGARAADGLKLLSDPRYVSESIKDRIAARAAEMVQDGDRVMIEASSTSARIVKYLRGKLGVEVITNSSLAFDYGKNNPDLRIIMTGGLYNAERQSFVGAVSWKAVRNFRARLAFVGADAVDVERGLMTSFGGGAEVAAAMADMAEETWLVADSSKFGRSESLSIMGLHALSGAITNRGGEDEEGSWIEAELPSFVAV